MATAKKKTRKQAGKKADTTARTRNAAEGRLPADDQSPEPQDDGGRSSQELMLVDGEYLPAKLMENPEFAKYAIAKRLAHTLSASNLVPTEYRGRPADCFIAMQMGAEVGLGPSQALQSIAVINGKPCIWGDALIGVVRASPMCEWIEETIAEDRLSATCKAKRRGDPNSKSVTFSMKDATTAGIANKDIWKKYPTRMLQMRARGFCLRDLFPDVLKGLAVAEEIMDYHASPAPIVDYRLPESPKAQSVDQPPPMPTNGGQPQTSATEAPSANDMTLAQVEKLIADATNMEFLLKAGEAAKLLTDANDIAAARLAYGNKRNLLINFGSGITDPAQGSPAQGEK